MNDREDHPRVVNPPLKFVAIAFNDYGGIGFEFYSAVVRPYLCRGRDTVLRGWWL